MIPLELRQCFLPPKFTDFYNDFEFSDFSSDFDAFVAEGWGGELPVQRLRPLLQDERHRPTPHQAQKQQGGELNFTLILTLLMYRLALCYTLYNL